MFIRKYGLYFAWLLSFLGTCTSLYFSDVRHLEPCHLCWYQRICLFPLSLILGIAAYQGFAGIVRYVLPLAIFGFLFALYQIALQEIPGLNAIDLCGAGPSCSEKVPIGLGPISIPMLSAACFFVIGLFLACVWITARKSQNKKLCNTAS